MLVLISCSNKGDISQIPQEFIFDNKYYHWDAKEDYWYGNYQYQSFEEEYENKEKYTALGDTYPDDPRLPNYIIPSGKSDRQASYSCKDCPSFNEVTWYMSAGVHYDENQEWAMQGEVFKGGFWLKRKEFIKSFTDSIPCSSIYDTISTIGSIKTIKGKPTKGDISQYFFLPAAGNYCSGIIGGVGEFGLYWTSTPSSEKSGWYVQFSGSLCSFWKCGQLDFAYRIWTAE